MLLLALCLAGRATEISWMDRIQAPGSHTAPEDYWDTTDRYPAQFPERGKATPGTTSHLPSYSPTSESYASTELSSDMEDHVSCDDYRKMLEHSVGMRDLKVALRHLRDTIVEHEELGEIFEGTSARGASDLTDESPSFK